MLLTRHACDETYKCVHPLYIPPHIQEELSQAASAAVYSLRRLEAIQHKAAAGKHALAARLMQHNTNNTTHTSGTPHTNGIPAVWPGAQGGAPSAGAPVHNTPSVHNTTTHGPTSAAASTPPGGALWGGVGAYHTTPPMPATAPVGGRVGGGSPGGGGGGHTPWSEPSRGLKEDMYQFLWDNLLFELAGDDDTGGGGGGGRGGGHHGTHVPPATHGAASSTMRVMQGCVSPPVTHQPCMRTPPPLFGTRLGA